MTTTDFIFNVPLYQKVTDEVDNIVKDLSQIFHESSVCTYPVFEGYNPQQGRESTYCVKQALETRYNIGGNRNYPNLPFRANNIWYCTLECRRYGDKIELCLWLDANDHSIMKVGQYPSVATIHIGQIRQYTSVLSKEDLKEFTRAIGLAANGVGIGSFVYMRRIFEKLIWVAAEEAIDAGVITEADFSRLRMDEKIETLRAYLPETLVELKDMYGILSKGVHELSEQECLAYFDVMRNGIELILDDKLEQKRKEEKRKSTLESMAKLKGTLKK